MTSLRDSINNINQIGLHALPQHNKTMARETMTTEKFNEQCTVISNRLHDTIREIDLLSSKCNMRALNKTDMANDWRMRKVLLECMIDVLNASVHHMSELWF